VKRLLLTVALTLFISAFAFAGFERTIHYKFDVNSPEAQNLEAGAVIDYLNVSSQMTLWVFDVYAKYGIMDNWEVALDVPFMGWDVDGGGNESGIGDMNIWTKYRFIYESESNVGAAAGINVKLSTGDDKLVGAGDKTDWMPFVMGTMSPCDKVTLGAKLGYNFVGTKDADDEFQYGIWGGYAVKENFGIVGELYGNSQKGDDPITFDAGITYGLAPNVGLVAGAGAGLNEVAPDWHMFLGLKGNFAFAP
jgi:hypothetical protein